MYEGQWVGGVRQGKGKISYSDGSFYRGDFQKDQMWGRGVYVGADGSQYDGEVCEYVCESRCRLLVMNYYIFIVFLSYGMNMN